ncbi:maternal effect protein staufen [Achroia grisella]|uniref:maternal effect protein staufen n=1 Tax=Achroia grisella TaxID=688607 RepID=UPI0027D26030|nr:maternal effect protein staufen [Achroia grisella]
MMHHPNMHHPPMSGHPPQHMPGHQAMPAHHQMPPHQVHRESRHVTITRVSLGPTQAGGGMGAHGHGHGHGQALGGMGAMAVPPPHHAQQRPPHAIRAMPHHPPAQHHSVPPQPMKSLRRPYPVTGGYGPASGPGVVPLYQPAHPPPAAPQPAPAAMPPAATLPHTGLRKPPPPVLTSKPKLNSKFGTSASSTKPASSNTSTGAEAVASASAGEAAAAVAVAVASADKVASAAPADGEAARPAPAQANSKEKTPMCLVNELARYNKIKHQYRLTSESGPAHKKVFTVTLRLGDTEEYTAEGSSIKRAQHAAATAALAGTGFAPPPPRAAPALAAAHPHHRHSGTVMPTVELNALAMKLCQPAVYTNIPPVAAAAAARLPRVRPPFRLPAPPHGPQPMPGFLGYQRMVTPGLVYRVRVVVGGRAWLGEGGTPQAARHDAAARALRDLRVQPAATAAASSAPVSPAAAPGGDAQPPADTDDGDGTTDLLSSEVKSPVSLVHELALKRNLSVQFSVKSERGPPHMRVFVTACTVGEIETEGEGNGKKVSKRRAAERMLDEMRRRWPAAMLRARPPQDRRRLQPAKKKPRNLIKEGGAGGGGSGGGGGGGGAGASGGADNPISRLAVARHAVRARSPQYRVVEERGAARRREFLVRCDAPPHSATGLGPNKKTAKRRAAHNVLLAMEKTGLLDNNNSTADNETETGSNNTADVNKNGDTKRKEGESGSGSGGAGGEVRQPVPGVLLMDYHQRSGQPAQPNGVSETSATGGNGGNTPGAKDQLMYLSELLGFTVQFSDFPKRNHGEYLSLVSLSTEPPVMCHGGGPSTQHSHEQCSRAALRALALMGLDAPQAGMATMGGTPAAKPAVISNGIAD